MSRLATLPLRATVNGARIGAGLLITRLIPACTAPLGYLLPRRQVVQVLPDAAVDFGPLVALFCHYDRRGAVGAHVAHYVTSLRRLGFSVVFVTNSGRLAADALARLQGDCAAIVIRRNIGYDFGAWRDALELFALPRANTELVILANDSLYGPIRPLDDLLSRLDPDMADVWGATDSWQTRYHLQSYFLALSRRVLVSDAWQRFWREVRPLPSKHSIVRRYEIGLSQTLIRAGFHLAALWPYADLQARVAAQGIRSGPIGALPEHDPMMQARQRHARRLREAAVRRTPLNPANDLWRQLLEAGFPFIKRELLRDNPGRVADVADWQQVLENQFQADIGPIEADLQRVLRNRAP
jgi:hypothetical protein